ncbi:type I restriction endonuclease subunit R [Miltoncostaea marina]|uniref:type I restriction endonuclease subunit R n=1 Tax=Miltoncostaea marina TaxID=2843215 RepID=UPI001C3D45DC|nr:type I restriction endonuclease [Miltoncostaea marina]
MAVLDHTEAGFETLIVDHLVSAGGWAEGDPKRYDRLLGLYPDDLVAFVKATQSKAWEKLVKHLGTEDSAGQALARRVGEQISKRGAIDLIRSGVVERGIRFKLCYFRPNLQADESGRILYDANRLTVVRQIHHDPARSQDSIDLVLFVNGIPTATAELKNKYSSTGWDVEEAIRQYREDRDPRNVLLGERALVHFALDGDLAYMTTRLVGEGTRFLPFNQGSGGPGQYGGKGNPLTGSAGHPTAYLWERVWQRDNWLELLDDFVFDEGDIPGRQVVFPRYHQWDVVRSCTAHAQAHGAGQAYLIQHSAGSGKTKEIAWLAHDLSALHGGDGRSVFDKVIVITDRRVLDAQLQRQIRAFAQTQSAVVEIDEDSQQLLDALTGQTAKVIITTLQKFPFVLQKLAGDDTTAQLKARRYAVIVDEAHSSQTGNAAVDLKAIIGARRVADLDLDAEEMDGVPIEMLAQMAARGKQPNISYFAFTATPKGRTLELFGTKIEGADRYAPFHIYSMRQAIEEGFVLDVLRNYTSYDQLYRLEAQAEKELPKGKARSRIAAFARFHPYAKSQKARVVLDHYERVVRPHLDGEAKAMVVCESRVEAVRWKQALDRIVEQEGREVRVLVAFSGEVEIEDPGEADFGETYRESQMNKIEGRPLPDSRLPAEFDKPAYGILVVAEKYQTGFDQPKLVAMYVDKSLTGINAVQTLSRLNRISPGKTDTYVLDFVNDPEDVLDAFEQYYGRTEALPSDPNLLSDAAQTVLDRKTPDGQAVIDAEEVAAFGAIYSPTASHHDLSARCQRSFAAAAELEPEGLHGFRGDLDRFVRFYKFLSQIVPFLAVEHEALFQFCRFLGLRLRARAEGGVSVADSIELTHYRLVEGRSDDLDLAGADIPDPLQAIRGDATGRGAGGDIPMGLLGELVELFNERFGADLSDSDAVRPVQDLIDKVAEIGEAQELRAQALGNSFEDFERGKQDVLLEATLQVKDINDLVLQKLLDDEAVREQMTSLVMRSLYERYRTEASPGS